MLSSRSSLRYVTVIYPSSHELRATRTYIGQLAGSDFIPASSLYPVLLSAPSSGGERRERVIRE